MRHYLSLITVAVLHVSAKWRTAHHLTKGKSRMFELIVQQVALTATTVGTAGSSVVTVLTMMCVTNRLDSVHTDVNLAISRPTVSRVSR